MLQENYGAIKARYPGEGRRRWRLRVAELFWSLPAEKKASYLTFVSLAASYVQFGKRVGDHSRRAPHAQISQNPLSAETIEEADFSTDDDPLDDISDDAPGVGILLRTDYSDEAAWGAFHAKLQEAEAEFASEEDTPAPDADLHGEAPSTAQGAA